MGPDGRTVIHHGQGLKQDLKDVRKKFITEAKRCFKEFVRI